MAKEMVTLAATWFTRINNTVERNFDALVKKAAKSGKHEIGAAFDLPNEEVTEFVRGYTATFAKKISDTTAAEISQFFVKAYEEAWSLNEIREKLEIKYTDWSTKRATMVARSETIRASNAGALFSYEHAGVEYVEWLAAEGDACPYCNQLNGKILPIGGVFLDVGHAIHADVDGVTKTMTNNYEPIMYPPAHPNCRCTIIASEGPNDTE